MSRYHHLVPYFPLSVIGFLLVVVIGSHFGLLPHIYDIAEHIVGLYYTYGLTVLFIAAIFEALAYIGLYVPAAALVALIVMSSDGSPLTFLILSFIVAVGVTLGGLLSYYGGTRRMFTNLVGQTDVLPRRTTWRWFLSSHWHANAIGLWYFKNGFQGGQLWPYIIVTPLIAWAWGFVACFGLYALKHHSDSDPLTLVFGALVAWLLIDVFLKWRQRRTFIMSSDET